MIGYYAAGILGTACGMLFWNLMKADRTLREVAALYEARIEKLEQANALLLATALEARGAQLIDPAQGPRMRDIAQKANRVNIEARLAQLAQDDAAKALDRDARVAAEMEEARRAVEEIRARMQEGGH